MPKNKQMSKRREEKIECPKMTTDGYCSVKGCGFCSTLPSQTPTDNSFKGVDERFNKQFCGKWDEIEDIQFDLGGDNHPDEKINIAEPIKDFIHQELTQARKEERMRVVKSLPEDLTEDWGDTNYVVENKIWNDCLSEVKKVIESL